MIIVIRLAKHEEVYTEQVLCGVLHPEILVTILVSKPVDYSAVERPHEDLDRQQQE